MDNMHIYHWIKLHEAIEQYLDSLRQYETSDDQPSYSMIEMPKLHIADQILKLLNLPTGPSARRSVES